ncbi:YlbG family protein [Lactobacillus sp. PSON]|uniref:YlbG family protein n=1 Tax=Lactobacillus sp. PSON TaxID=3455454 RepID=UPI0040424E55
MSINLDLKDSLLVQRTGLIIFLKNASDQYKLRRYGDIVYFSKKMCYCILYVDTKDAEHELNEISSLDFVKHVEFSQEENICLSSQHLEGQIADLAQEAEEKLLKKQTENEDKSE